MSFKFFLTILIFFAAHFSFESNKNTSYVEGFLCPSENYIQKEISPETKKFKILGSNEPTECNYSFTYLHTASISSLAFEKIIFLFSDIKNFLTITIPPPLHS
jgi:hypothetical protein